MENEKVDPGCTDCGRCVYDAPGSCWRGVHFSGQNGFRGEFPVCDGTCLRTESSGVDLRQQPPRQMCSAQCGLEFLVYTDGESLS